jgi:hypothetical protein
MFHLFKNIVFILISLDLKILEFYFINIYFHLIKEYISKLMII